MRNLIIIICILSLSSCKKVQGNRTTISKKVGSNKELPSDSSISKSKVNLEKSQNATDIEWQGTYHFEAVNRDNAKTAFDVVIKSLDDISIHIDDDGDQENYSNIKAQKINEDKIKIIYNASFKEDMGTIYMEKSDNRFYISGNPIYFINPGNNVMPLQKIK